VEQVKYLNFIAELVALGVGEIAVFDPDTETEKQVKKRGAVQYEGCEYLIFCDPDDSDGYYVFQILRDEKGAIYAMSLSVDIGIENAVLDIFEGKKSG
jgi:hypothetical protein